MDKDTEKEESTSRRRSQKFIPPGRRKCILCADGIKAIDYKQVGLLRNFLTDRGKIRPRHKTGTCGRHQRRLAVAVKRARHLALLPYTGEHVRRYQ